MSLEERLITQRRIKGLVENRVGDIVNTRLHGQVGHSDRKLIRILNHEASACHVGIESVDGESDADILDDTNSQNVRLSHEFACSTLELARYGSFTGTIGERAEAGKCCDNEREQHRGLDKKCEVTNSLARAPKRRIRVTEVGSILK